jgi:hypothetical protein
MMRRLLWAAAGAALGVAGYRRVSRLARGAGSRAVASFARDVRRGMDLYLERYPELAGPNLIGRPRSARRPPRDGVVQTDAVRRQPSIDNAKDGR